MGFPPGRRKRTHPRDRQSWTVPKPGTRKLGVRRPPRQDSFSAGEAGWLAALPRESCALRFPYSFVRSYHEYLRKDSGGARRNRTAENGFADHVNIFNRLCLCWYSRILYPFYTQPEVHLRIGGS